jgi:hypothetical protein
MRGPIAIGLEEAIEREATVACICPRRGTVVARESCCNGCTRDDC